MGSLIYNWAKSYIEKHDNKRKERENLQIAMYAAEKDIEDKLINKFRKQYLEEIINKFKETIKPKFEIGEIVTTNWYGPGSYWDGTMKMLQAHTPFKGPIDVEITKVILDYCEISEIIDELKRRGEFDNKYTNHSYASLKRIVDGHRKEYDISWAYNIKVPGDDYEYWRYSIRENKFLKTKSNAAKWSKKCYANEVEAARLYEEKKILDEKIRRQVEKITKTKIIVR